MFRIGILLSILLFLPKYKIKNNILIFQNNSSKVIRKSKIFFAKFFGNFFMKFKFNNGGSKFKLRDDCVIRAIAIATEQDYTKVLNDFKKLPFVMAKNAIEISHLGNDKLN